MTSEIKKAKDKRNEKREEFVVSTQKKAREKIFEQKRNVNLFENICWYLLVE